MKIKMTVTGLDEVRAQMRYASREVPDGARKEMRRSAERVVKQAQLNAPVDTGNLEESIRIEKSYGERGRLQIDVVAGGGDLEPYATIMHESDYTLGPRSRLKQAALSGLAKVGRKFLTRALNSEKKTIQQGIQASVSRNLTTLFAKVKKGLGR